jgi:ferredoxin
MHMVTLRIGTEPELRLAVRGGETLDAALSRSGLARGRKGCRRGGCGQCLVTVVAGLVVDERPIAPQVLTPAHRASGGVLACRAVPGRDLVVGAEPGQIRCVSPLQWELAQRELARESGRPEHLSIREGS